MAAKRKRRETKPGKAHTTISGHKRKGKTLIPPLGDLPNASLASWIDDRLPEMLWAVLLVTHLDRYRALDVFRQVAQHAHRNLEDLAPPAEITHSGLAQMPAERLELLLRMLCVESDVRTALSPLAMLTELPAREAWLRAIQAEPQQEHWHRLGEAVAKTLNHQSQEATDCRWCRALVNIAMGKLHFPGARRDLVEEIVYYPERGDMRAVRPSIRATEGVLAAMSSYTSEWPKRFWAQCMHDTPCRHALRSSTHLCMAIGTTAARIDQVTKRLVAHCDSTRSTTGVDAKHDAVFGLGLFALGILRELMRIGASTSISGRTHLRTLVECHINLAYLVRKDDPAVWQAFRRYGAGQAKLAFLKLDEADDPPLFVDVQTLEMLADEDMWLEYVPIQVGHWGNSDLRKMSEDAGVKAEYDRYYGWTSGFAHAQWAAVRDTVFETCRNPLHRLHRIPRDLPRALNDVVPDACLLVDQVLDTVDRAYPPFCYRVSLTNGSGSDADPGSS